MKTAYLSLGSNLGDRRANLATAVKFLNALGVRVIRASSIYETEPQDLHGQPWFLNQVIEIETSLFPRQLLARTQQIERAMGRKRTVPRGPRPIDIDILLFGATILKTADLEIPHPRMMHRRFVLEPLHELSPDMRHPATSESVREMLSRVADQIARRA